MNGSGICEIITGIGRNPKSLTPFKLYTYPQRKLEGEGQQGDGITKEKSRISTVEKHKAVTLSLISSE